MAVKRIIVCDVCEKQEDFNNPYRKKWFIENICNTICSEECFEKGIIISKLLSSK